MAYQSINPNDGKLVKTFDEMSDKALQAAIAAAETCYGSWRRTGFALRAAIANRLLKVCAITPMRWLAS